MPRISRILEEMTVRTLVSIFTTIPSVSNAFSTISVQLRRDKAILIMFHDRTSHLHKLMHDKQDAKARVSVSRLSGREM